MLIALICTRVGNEIAIPLYVLEDNPVEMFLSTANNIIQVLTGKVEGGGVELGHKGGGGGGEEKAVGAGLKEKNILFW